MFEQFAESPDSLNNSFPAVKCHHLYPSELVTLFKIIYFQIPFILIRIFVANSSGCLISDWKNWLIIWSVPAWRIVFCKFYGFSFDGVKAPYTDRLSHKAVQGGHY